MSFLMPSEIIKKLPILAGDTILDIGSGSGAYSIELAKLSLKNKVIAIDINRNVLDLLSHNATTFNLNHIETIEMNIQKPWPIAPLSADGALLINIMHAVNDKDKVLRYLHDTLKPHAYAILVDWRDVYKFGPGGNYIIKENDMIEIVNRNGFKVKSNIPAGSHHYGLLLETA